MSIPESLLLVARSPAADLLLFLAVAGLLVPLGARVRLEAVIVFLGCGALMGPNGLGALVHAYPALSFVTFSNHDSVHHLAEAGVLFLMFAIGLELSLDRLWRMRRLVLGLGMVQMLATTVPFAGILIALGLAPFEAAVIGIALAFSSTAVVIEVLTRNGQLERPVGRTAFAVLLLQDLAVIPVLLFVARPAGEGFGWIDGLRAMAEAVLVVGAMAVLGKLGLRRLFRWVGRARRTESFVAITLLAVLGTAALSDGLGLSASLGAFLAGVLMAESEYRHRLELEIEPFRGLLLGLFFLSVGFQIEPALILSQGGPLALALLAVIGIKALVLSGAARLFGIGWATSVETGLLLAQPGEFGFVLISAAVAAGLTGPTTLAVVALLTAAGMAATPLLGALGRRISRRLAAYGMRGADAPTILPGERPILIAGFGRFGQLIGRMLHASGIPYVAVDLDPGLVARGRRAGLPVLFGDAGHPQMLARLGAARALAIVVTMDDRRAVERLVAELRHALPHVPILARGRDADHAQSLRALGATLAVPEALEASLALGAEVLAVAGVDAGLIVTQLADQRRAALGAAP